MFSMKNYTQLLCCFETKTEINENDALHDLLYSVNKASGYCMMVAGIVVMLKHSTHLSVYSVFHQVRFHSAFKLHIVITSKCLHGVL